MAGKLIELDEESLKLCEELGRLNSKKFEMETQNDEALKKLEQYAVSLREKHLL
jgi:hypothetical protein